MNVSPLADQPPSIWEDPTVHGLRRVLLEPFESPVADSGYFYAPKNNTREHRCVHVEFSQVRRLGDV